MPPGNMASLANSLLTLQSEVLADPMAGWAPTPPQEQWLRSNARIKMFRGGNQIGKSAVGIVELLSRLKGKHPYLTVKPPPIEAWAVFHSWEQSKILQAKLYDMVCKADLHPDVEFVKGRGFRGTGAPCVRFKNGSILRIKTTQQARGGQTLSLASGTVDYVWIDEPPPPNVIGELFGRVVRTRGTIGITLTPVGVPCDYLQSMVESGQITEVVAPLTVENVTPKGCRPLMTQDEIDQVALNYLPIDRAARMTGAWIQGIPEGRVFDQFKEELISNVPPNTNSADFRFALGVDHGSDAGSQVCVLVAIDVAPRDKGKLNPFVYVLDEYVAGAAPAEVPARAILAMLKRNNLEMAHIHYFTGDRSHGGNRYGGRMSNQQLTAAFAHIMGYPVGRLPFRIRTAFKPKFSVFYTCSVLHSIMAKSRFQVFPRCKNLIRSIQQWAMKKTGGLKDDENKHAVDALRYACMPILNVSYRTPTHSKLHLR